MRIEERIDAFSKLGVSLDELPEQNFQSIAEQARLHNPWFTEPNVRMAVRGIVKMLDHDNLIRWTSNYKSVNNPQKIAVIMAGNIPLVGFHDFLSVLVSGHHILIKCSSKDSTLIKFIANKLIEIEPQFQSAIEYGEILKGFDAIIATGSDNSSRYFEYYFGKYPNIIRKNRTSIAILTGSESKEDLTLLGIDVFSYFGLGCRNVSKVYIPENYSLEKLFVSWEPYHDTIHHHKYCNNYDYQKSLLLVGRKPFLDNGFVMLEESQKLVSPISIVYYERYTDEQQLRASLERIKEKTQCTIENSSASSVKFGQAQYPAVTDYADRIDTLQFLTELT
jgi:hypothetical protein